MPRGIPLASEYEAVYLPTTTTNNVAEYTGLISALKLSKTMHLTHLQVCGDSQLLMQQMRGLARVLHPGLRAPYITTRSLAAHFHCDDR